MQVMLLIHADESAWARMPEAGALVNSNRLMPTAASHAVLVVDGTPKVLDGPYAETR